MVKIGIGAAFIPACLAKDSALHYYSIKEAVPKVEKFLQKIYGITLTVSFFAGLLPLIPFVAAIIIGGGEGGTGEAISTWL
jgi:hypothetical protein